MDNAEYACYCDMFDHITKANPPSVDLIGQILHAVIIAMVKNFPFPSICYSVPEDITRDLLSEADEPGSGRREACNSGEHNSSLFLQVTGPLSSRGHRGHIRIIQGVTG